MSFPGDAPDTIELLLRLAARLGTEAEREAERRWLHGVTEGHFLRLYGLQSGAAALPDPPQYMVDDACDRVLDAVVQMIQVMIGYAAPTAFERAEARRIFSLERFLVKEYKYPITLYAVARVEIEVLKIAGFIRAGRVVS